ncbi:hypothetical protein JR316_0009028 [Psilocybe cubensis]|uniref:Uncharacterized protein n=2 Tax=Psilocybe cubensis TaxID=181762 RepID=A0A8H7XYY3_PSICU|nr:hypothetical protein JR316_0009028 [Psilocybe cubensis]KAH9478571.1 hypothetical protein JR316_0009028 [Psilocybe cubensis]
MHHSFQVLAFSLAALHCMGALASPAVSPQVNNILSRADAPDEEFVITPGGPVLKSNVHSVPQGARVEHIGETISIVSANGTTLKSTPFTSANRSPHQRRDIQSGYVGLAYWSNGADPNPISSFSTFWVVPEVPEVVDGQTIFIFNGLEPDAGDAILQPVLQYGGSAAGGGNYWALSSWWVIGTSAFFTPLVQVPVNQGLTGLMTLQSITNTEGVAAYNYNSVFTGFPGTSLSISSTRPLPLAFEALEVYSAKSPTYLPRGRTSMRGIDIIKNNGVRPTVIWSTIVDTAEGFTMSVVSNGVPNGQVDIFYPLQ